MQQRLSLITLGVADVRVARDFYERLGWTCAKDSDAQGVAFFQAGGMALPLWARAELARDSTVTDGGGWGGYSGIFIDPDGHPWEVAHNPLPQRTIDCRPTLSPTPPSGNPHTRIELRCGALPQGDERAAASLPPHVVALHHAEAALHCHAARK